MKVRFKIILALCLATIFNIRYSFPQLMKNYVLIGLNNFGVEIAKNLTDAGAEVTVIDRNREHVAKVSPAVKHALMIEHDDLSPLKELKLSVYDAVIVMVTEDVEFSLACLLVLNKLKVGNMLICTGDENQERLVALFGESTIIRIDKEIGHILTERLLTGNFN
jgi:trk system potassium uptake protein